MSSDEDDYFLEGRNTDLEDEDYEECKSNKSNRDDQSLFYNGPLRSFACEKHSKWKKKCPTNCPLRKELTRMPHVRRKLWTKRESALLVQWAGEDPLQLSSKEADVMWEEIAKTLNRSVNSTKKKFMRYSPPSFPRLILSFIFSISRFITAIFIGSNYLYLYIVW